MDPRYFSTKSWIIPNHHCVCRTLPKCLTNFLQQKKTVRYCVPLFLLTHLASKIVKSIHLLTLLHHRFLAKGKTQTHTCTTCSLKMCNMQSPKQLVLSSNVRQCPKITWIAEWWWRLLYLDLHKMQCFLNECVTVHAVADILPLVVARWTWVFQKEETTLGWSPLLQSHNPAKMFTYIKNVKYL